MAITYVGAGAVGAANSGSTFTVTGPTSQEGDLLGCLAVSTLVGGLVNAAANPTADALVHLRGNFTGRVHLRNAYIPGYKSALRDFSAEASAAEQARTFPQVVAGGSFHYPMKYGVVNME